MKKLLKFALFIFLAFLCPILIYNSANKIKTLEEQDSIIDRQLKLENDFLIFECPK